MFEFITLKGLGPRRSTLRGVGPDGPPLPVSAPALEHLPLDMTWDDESNIRENGFSLHEILWFRETQATPALFLTSEDPFGSPFTLGDLILANAETELPAELLHALRFLGVGKQYTLHLGCHGSFTFTRVR